MKNKFYYKNKLSWKKNYFLGTSKTKKHLILLLKKITFKKYYFQLLKNNI